MAVTPLKHSIEDTYHDFLIPSDVKGHDPIELAIKAREAIADFPETKATFKQKDVFDDTESVPSSFWVPMVTLLGSWRIPGDIFTTGARGTSIYVNPKYEHRTRYADVAVQCECGEVITRFSNPSKKGLNPISDINNSHADGCRKEWRLQTRANIWKNRREIIEQSLWLGKSAKSSTYRLDTDKGNIVSYTGPLELDVQTRREKSRERMGKTINLLREEHNVSTIAQVYGFSASKASDLSNKYPVKETLNDFNCRKYGTKYPAIAARAEADA